MADAPEPTTQWLRGVLDLCLLASVAREPLYGYEMTSHLAASGLDAVAEGSIYPALARLERAGLVEGFLREGSGGPPRKYYRLTSSGAAHLRTRAGEWREFVSAVGSVLDTGKVTGGRDG
jgi:PadR family transcriptional regulator PadR